MSEQIAVALIGAIASVVGVMIANQKSNKKIEKNIEQKLLTAQAVTDTKIDELTREVREHNNFARRMPVVENEIQHIETDINTLKKFHEGGN